MQERQQLAHDMHNLQAQVSLCYILYSDLRLLFNFKPDDCLKVYQSLKCFTYFKDGSFNMSHYCNAKKYCFYYSKINHYEYIWIHFN